MTATAVVGSRDWPEPDRVARLVARLAEGGRCVVVSGGACGADRTAEAAAARAGVPVVSYRVFQGCVWRVEWEGTVRVRVRVEGQPPFRSVRDALLWRNGRIAAACDRMVAFHVGAPWRAGAFSGTPGTSDAIRKAVDLGRPVYRLLPGVRDPEVYCEAEFLRAFLAAFGGKVST